MQLLIDLDGTLTDSAPGIVRCIQHAMRALDRQAWPAERLTPLIGASLHDALGEALETRDEALIAEAIRLYRERFAEVGLFENTLYADVAEGLSHLRADGHRLFLATSKPLVFARRIIAHFDVAQYFDALYGSELSGERADKAELIAHLLASEGIGTQGTWMIGDRTHDIRGARANGIGAVAVAWGYGTADEWSHADAVVHSMQALRLFLNNRSD